ncbi:MAG TPA: 3-keto-5-aminohexanoate cleavage protein, partial [Kiloniellaceae bacterium]|nr:3-keto-5-aminohexanoate cleavage protein [Kiloniellaceae bacterium]
RGGSPRTISVDGRRSLTYLLDQVQRVEPRVAFSVPAMPDRIAVSGVEFVEFAADQREAAELGGLLRQLGFRRAGRHIAKEVELWRQGGINVVVNTEPEGFAHSSYLMHGTAVCDLGLKVEDAAATVERARALGADLFEQPVGPGELKIPAIRGVGGGVMHFIDDRSELARVWEIEFQPVEDEQEAEDLGLVSVDHIAQTMRYEEMLTWLLFYTAIFKTHKTPMVDVVDPAGLVRSQVIENETGSLRITLNGAENRKTLAGRFITESFGSAVQHIAFRSSDIFATASKLAGRGFRPLEISANYYDDLAARFALDDALLQRLRDANILYDRDEGGEYFQLYAPSYGEGFFFEIVERRGGYNGYGAANAQFRIAAQKRALEDSAVATPLRAL